MVLPRYTTISKSCSWNGTQNTWTLGPALKISLFPLTGPNQKREGSDSRKKKHFFLHWTEGKWIPNHEKDTIITWISFTMFKTVFNLFLLKHYIVKYYNFIWAPSSEFVSSSIPSWKILTGHAQPFRGARDLAFCLKVPLDSLLVWASSEGSGETARMRRLAWTFAARTGDKYQIRLTRSI